MWLVINPALAPLNEGPGVVREEGEAILELS